MRVSTTLTVSANTSLNKYLLLTLTPFFIITYNTFFATRFACRPEINIKNCGENTMCATWISIYLLIGYILKLIHRSIESTRRKDIAIQIEKIAKLKISWRRAIQGVMVAVMAGCGAFLFALMSAEKPNKDFVTAIGSIGTFAGASCVITEIYIVIKRGIQPLHPRITPEQELVDGCSWWFTAASFLVTTSNTVLWIIFAITLEDWIEKFCLLILPLVATCMVIGESRRGTKRRS